MDELLNEIKGLHELLKQKDAQAEAEIKARGEAAAETKATIARIEERMDSIETEMSRPDAGKDNPDERLVRAADGMSRLAQRNITVDDVRAHDAAFFQFVREGKAGLSADERKALVEDATGEIIVPFELEAGVLRVLPQLNVMRPLVASRNTVRDRISLRSLTEVSVGWGKLETGTAITESSFTPAQQYAYVEDLYGLTKIGEDELMDTDVALTEIVSSSFGIAIANAEEAAIINGAKHASGEPEGILVHTGNAPDGTAIVTHTAAQPGGATGGTLTLDDLYELEYALKPQYAARAEWVVNRATAKSMRLLKDSNGRYLWMQGGVTGGSLEREPSTFDGAPVHQSVAMPTIAASGTATTGAALFADFKSGYTLIDRLGMTLQRLNELYAESGLIGFRVHRRVGGAVIRGEAIARLDVPSA